MLNEYFIIVDSLYLSFSSLCFVFHVTSIRKKLYDKCNTNFLYILYIYIEFIIYYHIYKHSAHRAKSSKFRVQEINTYIPLEKNL